MNEHATGNAGPTPPEDDGEPFSSERYWDDRYQTGGNSGSGSYGRLAVYKANQVNEIVHRFKVKEVIELGCGDGNQLSLFSIRKYIGLDVSPLVVERCRALYSKGGKRDFRTMQAFGFAEDQCDMSMSLDVIYHLVEDSVFETYLQRLFRISRRLVLIYASDGTETADSSHVRHRKYSDWVARNQPDWEIVNTYPQPFPKTETSNPRHTTFAFFRLYRKINREPAEARKSSRSG